MIVRKAEPVSDMPQSGTAIPGIYAADAMGAKGLELGARAADLKSHHNSQTRPSIRL